MFFEEKFDLLTSFQWFTHGFDRSFVWVFVRFLMVEIVDFD